MKFRHLLAGAALAGLATSAHAGMDLSRDIVARGSTPAWSLTVSGGTQFTLTRPGKPVLKASAPGAAITPNGASWTAATADGQPLKVTLQSRSCAAGGAQQPMTAQVVVGGETLSGCAAPAK